ncbi:hypothetical protein OKA04_20005 [Luteolibacter flavescens]|uniref:CBM-cenC domain-containing protein n=1 Tax=Luteolibacter flavescens TaxID=1859460 RepID=A0ABT3FUC6_9BACT|nr:hypothetical protein [Luteolibacter flavescens]MCW1887032.1 hypothetical protein [Luteolibacter flavescens]
MSDLPAHPPEADELSELFARFLDQRLDEKGHRRLEDLLRDDPAARDRCAKLLLFDAEMKDALEPSELEWLETRRVVLARRDGRPAMEIQRSQELRVGPRARLENSRPGKRRKAAAIFGSFAVLAAAAAFLVPRFLHPVAAPVLRNPGFEITDLSLNTTGNTTALIEWQDYFSTLDADLCEIGRVSGGRVFAKSGRNVARLKRGGHLTQRLQDEHGKPITARPGARYVLTGWAYTDGTGTHVLRPALRVVASGWPAMIQYEAATQRHELPQKDGWQQFRVEFDLGQDLEREPSDVTITERPTLDLKGREMTLSLDSRGDKGSVFYLDDLSLEVKGD